MLFDVPLTALYPPESELKDPQSAIAEEPPRRFLEEQTIRSALWAAWGDAAGFPAELAADRAALQRRFDGDTHGSGGWRRRIGGRMGPTIELPAGTYSDDTQLRLAVARCIREPGRFDVEAFSKIELPVFLSYELGAGKGTKSAARALNKRTARWYANFYDKPSRYVDGGGNGAAMRIQPHVWAAPSPGPRRYLPAVIRDTLSTHGHPRAILGSALHAIALGSTLGQRQLPAPARWPGMIDFLDGIPDLIDEDEQLRSRWLPQWEERAGETFPDALLAARISLKRQAEIAASLVPDATDDLEHRYAQLLHSLGGLDPSTRGAGDTTALISLWVAWCGQARPAKAIMMTAGTLGSDTDTVATMAGALLGAVVDHEPQAAIADRELHITEAKRLHRLGHGQRAESFPHPDPLHWEAPRTLSDALGILDGKPAVAGLGPVTLEGEPIRGKQGTWQWARTDYGQRLLVKRHEKLTELPDHTRRRPRTPIGPTPHEDAPHIDPDVQRVFPDDPEQGALLAASRRFDRRLIGDLWHHYAAGTLGTAKAAYFATRAAELYAASAHPSPHDPEAPLQTNLPAS